MYPISISISNSVGKINIVTVWSDDLGCFVGSEQLTPEVQRTGDSIGEVMDKLTETHAKRTREIFGFLAIKN